MSYGRGGATKVADGRNTLDYSPLHKYSTPLSPPRFRLALAFATNILDIRFGTINELPIRARHIRRYPI